MQAWGAAAFVMLVTVVCFIVMFLMLRQQQQGVAVLNDVGERLCILHSTPRCRSVQSGAGARCASDADLTHLACRPRWC